MIGTRVPILLSAGGPSAVARRVVAVVVDTLNGQPSRTLAHIRQESREVVSPFFTHRDPAATVVLERGTAVVKASVFGGGPALVLARAIAPSASLRSVCGSARGDTLSHEAVTTCRLAGSQLWTSDALHGSACALTDPPAVDRPCLWGETDHGETTIDGACEIDQIGHDGTV